MFQGPGRAFGVPEVHGFEQELEIEKNRFDQALARQSSANQAASGFGASVARADAQEREDQAGQQALAMTPGVSRGGSTATTSTPGSPLNTGSSSSFQRYGNMYSYDANAAATQKGMDAGTAATTAQDVHYQALQKIPGISQKQASKLVYGRDRILDEGEDDAVRQANAAYTRNPSRETAADAVALGAKMNEFPDRFLKMNTDGSGYDQPLKPPTPARGSEDYYRMLDRERGIQSRYRQEETDARLTQAADLKPDQRDRYRTVYGPKGEIGRQDLETNDVEWSGAMGRRPLTAPSNEGDAALFRAMNGGAPADAQAPAQRIIPPGGANPSPAYRRAYGMPEGEAPPTDQRNFQRSSGASTPSDNLEPLSAGSRQYLNSSPTDADGQAKLDRFKSFLRSKGYRL